MSNITAIRGFKDILPEESGKWQFVEEKAREVFNNFGLSEIRVPILEKTELFKRGIGETTDIVEKEMYTFKDLGDDSLTLRPEATASVIRAYLEHNMYKADPITKLFTIGPMFRRERPQKGRFRQFHQINVELIGLDDPRVDAELILLLVCFLKSVNLPDLGLEINSLGCSKCRDSFRLKLSTFLTDWDDRLCPDCKRRNRQNPLRVFDCKNEICQELISDAPKLLNYICPECENHFERLKEYLEIFGIPFIVNTKMVRGLDYYTRTAFEVTTELLGAQNAIAGGGRYDRLVKELGGPDIPGIGFAIGIERLISLLTTKDEDFATHPHLFIAALGKEAQKFAYTLCNQLRIQGIRTEMDFSDRSLKSQMKRSDKLNCLHTLIIGEREIDEGKAPLRDMATKEQNSIDIQSIEGIIQTLINLKQ